MLGAVYEACKQKPFAAWPPKGCSSQSGLAYLVALSALRFAAFGSTAALNLAPATNFGTVVAGIFRAAPVAGFLPVRAVRFVALKVPKPTSCTGSPFFTVAWMVSINVSKTAFAAVLERPFLVARISTSSARFISSQSKWWQGRSLHGAHLRENVLCESRISVTPPYACVKHPMH